jgi:all-trans-8'-apo-beta-carotenal 15,15'-oxygenase
VVLDTAQSDTHCLLNDKGLGVRPSGGRFLFDDLDYERDVPLFRLVRYTIHLASGKFSKRLLSPRHADFPSVSKVVRGRPSRYIYCSPGAKDRGVSPYMGVLKVDALDASKSQIWLPGPSEFCGEATFQPREGSEQEADGHVMTLCFNGDNGRSDLLVFDAQRVDLGPVASVPLDGIEVPGTGGDGAAGERDRKVIHR